jgi:hypothetical protein
VSSASKAKAGENLSWFIMRRLDNRSIARR